MKNIAQMIQILNVLIQIYLHAKIRYALTKSLYATITQTVRTEAMNMHRCVKRGTEKDGKEMDATLCLKILNALTIYLHVELKSAFCQPIYVMAIKIALMEVTNGVKIVSSEMTILEYQDNQDHQEEIFRDFLIVVLSVV